MFHGEADFQHALAWQLQLLHPDAEVRLEKRPLPGRAVFLDLAVTVEELRVAVELKYLVRELSAVVAGEAFALRPQSAHDVRRYDVVKDICRLEELVAAGVADAGIAVVLTNDAAYWRPGRVGTVDAAYRLDEERVLTGTMSWAAHAGAGTTRGREKGLAIAGAYTLGWADYSDLGVPAGRFRHLLVDVTPTDDAGRAVGGASSGPPTSPAQR